MMVSNPTSFSGVAAAVLLLACSGPPPDANPPDVRDVHISDAPFNGGVVIGQHPSSVTNPAQFVPIEDGDEVDVVLGTQGLFMVVLGLKSKAYFSGVMQLKIDITSENGDEVASLARKDIRTIRSEDGFDYVWEAQVIIDGEIWIGTPLNLTVSAVDEEGTSFEDSRVVVLVKPALVDECIAPSPPATRVTDTCAQPTGLSHYLEAGAVDSLHIAPGPAEGGFIVGGHRGADLLLWSSGDDVSPFPGVLHQDINNTGPWIEPSGVIAGPWALAIPGKGAAIVWGGADGATRFTAPGGEPIVVGNGLPLTAFPAPDGFKILIDLDGVVRIHAFSSEAVEIASHFVVSTVKAGGPLATSLEGELVVVTFPGTTPEQPMLYQTASIFGGQCSLPAPLGLVLGEGTIREAYGVSYGLPVLAVTRPAVEIGCSPSYRVLSKSLSGNAFLDTESSVSWANGARVVARDGVATLVGLQETADGWRPAAQFTDQAELAPGKSAVGPGIGGLLPTQWDVTHSGGRYGITWSGSSGVWLQRFCFQDPE